MTTWDEMYAQVQQGPFRMLEPSKRGVGPRGGKTTTRPMGYAAIPGTGPEGETCGSCAHLYRNRMANTYLKCGLMRGHWTGGAKTDVLAKSPACAKWEGSL